MTINFIKMPTYEYLFSLLLVRYSLLFQISSRFWFTNFFVFNFVDFMLSIKYLCLVSEWFAANEIHTDYGLGNGIYYCVIMSILSCRENDRLNFVF